MKVKSPKIAYSLKLAANGFFKNKMMTFSSILVLISCLVIMGTFFVVIKNINYNVNEIDGLNKIVLFVDREATSQETAEIGDKLLQIKGIANVEFVDRDTALKKEAEKLGNSNELREMFEKHQRNNPLKDSYIITYDKNADVETIKLNIERNIDHIAKLNIDMEAAEKVQNLKNVISIIFSWLMILLLAVSFFVIMNTVKLSVYARRDEIALMRYIGATNTFISAPFLIEGLAIGAVSAGCAFGLQFLIYKYLMLELVDQYEIISILPFSSVMNILVIGFIFTGVLMGFLGSIVSLKKYNKENA